MRRREFIMLLGGAAAWPLAARAQDGRTYRIGVLNANPRGSPLVTALFDELRRNGLVEGRNLVTEGSGIGIPYPRFPDVARELAKAKVEVLVVGGGSPPIRSVQAVAPGIPIIGVAGPVALDGTPPRAPAHALSRPPARSERSAQGDIRGYGSGGEGVRRLTYSRSAWEI